MQLYLNGKNQHTLPCRPVASGCRGCEIPPNQPKSPLLATKWGFCRRAKGVKFKKSTFWVQKVHFSGVVHAPKSILSTGLVITKANTSYGIKILTFLKKSGHDVYGILSNVPLKLTISCI